MFKFRSKGIVWVSPSLNVDWVGLRLYTFVVSSVLLFGSLIAIALLGLNLGIDFAGGSSLQVRTANPPDLPALRQSLGGLGLGDVSLQTIDAPGRAQPDVMVRIERQAGGPEAQAAALSQLTAALPPGASIEATETVGPQVGGELREAATISVLLAMAGIAAYIWLRFEWQFALGVLLATLHDVVGTLGLFAVTQMEFNLTTVAALLTIAGYSVNDTVVVYDRIREMMRKYKSQPLRWVFNTAINQTMSRTLLTSGSTLLALIALYFLGGEVIRGFVAAMIWGILIGTYSSVFVATPFLLLFRFRRGLPNDGT